MSARRGPRISFAFVTGILGALLILAGATMPQLSVPDRDTGPLFDTAAMLADPLGATGEAGSGVVVFALFAIAFCLVRRYLWLIFCAIMIVLFLSVSLMRQLTDMLGLTIPQIIDIHNGILPPNVDPSVASLTAQVLEAATYDTGLLVLGVGLILIAIAPGLRRLQFGSSRWQTVARTAQAPRREPTAVAQASPPPEESRVPSDLLLDELYIFAEGLDQPLTFTLLDPSGRVTRHRVRLEAAGYLGDSYFLRCRDLDAGNLRDVPAHMMSDIVDDLTGAPIDTDDMLEDLARVAYEVVAGVPDDDGPDGAAEADSAETGENPDPKAETRPQDAG